MPTTTFQYYVSPDSNGVSITATLFGVGGVTLDTETTTRTGITGDGTVSLTYSITHIGYPEIT